MKILVYDDNIDDIKQLENCITNFLIKSTKSIKLHIVKHKKNYFH